MEKNLDNLIENSLKFLPYKHRYVIVNRFGLASGQRATLQAIGDRLGVTRERVRQIEEKILEKLKPVIRRNAFSLLDLSENHLKNAGGIRDSELFLNEILSFLKENVKNGREKLKFIYFISGLPSYYEEDENFKSFWYLNEKIKNEFIEFHNKLLNLFQNHDKNVIFNEKIYFSHFKKISEFHYLSISKRISINCFGDLGLCEWEEINPKTVRDKIYLVLKKKKQPLHFTEIARQINELNLDQKKVNFQTVHNELIKDERFVLVGRGIYGLREYGYEPGTVREIITSILKKYGPLSKEEIIRLVNEKRFFRPQTIVINLQNRHYFKKLDNGLYYLKSK